MIFEAKLHKYKTKEHRHKQYSKLIDNSKSTNNIPIGTCNAHKVTKSMQCYLIIDFISACCILVYGMLHYL